MAVVSFPLPSFELVLEVVVRCSVRLVVIDGKVVLFVVSGGVTVGRFRVLMHLMLCRASQVSESVPCTGAIVPLTTFELFLAFT